jgi:hypothetical protein
VSSPVYAYGIKLLPAARVAREVMRLNAQLEQTVWETGAIFTFENLDLAFQVLVNRS